MHFLRRFLLILLTPLFVILLFSTAIDWGFVSTAGNSGSVKTILAKSGVYSSITPSLLDQAKTIQANGIIIPLDNSEVRAAANQVFSSQLYQNNTEGAVDSIYAWLEGKTPSPNFKVDFAAAKVDFANNLSQKVQQRLSSLPRCSTPTTSFDYFNATCLPAGVDPATVAIQVKNSVLSGSGFLDKPLLTAGDIKSSNNKSVFADQLKDTPKQFQNAKKSPYILAVLSVVTGLAIIFLSSTKRKGVRHVSIVLLLVGVFMLAFAWAENKAISQEVVPKIKLDNQVMQTKVRTLVTDVSQHIDKNYWLFGGLYALLGTIGLVFAAFTGREPKAPQPQAPRQENEDRAQTQSPSPTRKPTRPKPKKIIIQ